MDIPDYLLKVLKNATYYSFSIFNCYTATFENQKLHPIPLLLQPTDKLFFHFHITATRNANASVP